MATPVPEGSVWLFTCKGSLAGQTILNTHHLVYNGVGTIVDYEALAVSFLNEQATSATQFLANLKPFVTTDFTFTALFMQPIWANRYNAVSYNIAGQTGSQSPPTLPPNVALTLTKRSVNATRWGRGSNHIAGCPTSGGVSGVWGGAILALAAAYATTISGPWAGGGTYSSFRPVLWNRSNPSRVTTVQSASAQATMRVERRRTVGVGI